MAINWISGGCKRIKFLLKCCTKKSELLLISYLVIIRTVSVVLYSSVAIGWLSGALFGKQRKKNASSKQSGIVVLLALLHHCRSFFCLFFFFFFSVVSFSNVPLCVLLAAADSYPCGRGNHSDSISLVVTSAGQISNMWLPRI